jgi:hypothetical protein
MCPYKFISYLYFFLSLSSKFFVIFLFGGCFCNGKKVQYSASASVSYEHWTLHVVRAQYGDVQRAEIPILRAGSKRDAVL